MTLDPDEPQISLILSQIGLAAAPSQPKSWVAAALRRATWAGAREEWAWAPCPEACTSGWATIARTASADCCALQLFLGARLVLPSRVAGAAGLRGRHSGAVEPAQLRSKTHIWSSTLQPNLDRTNPKFGQTIPKYSQAESKFGRSAPKFGQECPDSAELVQNWPKTCPNSVKQNPYWPKWRRLWSTWPQIVRKRPSIGRNTPRVG